MKRLAYLFTLAAKSAWNRKGTLALIVASIALSTMLLVGIEHVRRQVRQGFVQAVSGTDLVVGARGGGVQLVLYAIFHLGGATNNMGWESARKLSDNPQVAWAIPLSLGDSHHGYPVVATTPDFFRHYRYGSAQPLEFARGQSFDGVFDVVLGSEVARKLGYSLEHKLTLSHGQGGQGLTEHGDKPFSVTGVLKPTGTPVDRSLYISLAGMEAIHIDWRGGAPVPGLHIAPDQVKKFNLEPKSITALLLGLKNRARVFAVQREINGWRDEALTGVMPGVALDQIWRMVNTGETALLCVSALVTVTGLAGLAACILAGLGERRRELAVLRSAGARPMDILMLLASEGVLLTLTGMVCGLLCLAGMIAALGPWLLDAYGIALHAGAPEDGDWILLAGISVAGVLASLIPAYKAYRLSLADGLTVNV